MGETGLIFSLIFALIFVSWGSTGKHSCEKNWFENVTVMTKESAPDSELFRANVNDLWNETIVAVLKTKIPILCEGAIRDLVKLATLQLSRLGIETLEPHPFQNLYSIKYLFLKENYLEEIPNGVFSGMYVEYLDLSGNRIGNVEQFAFDNMPALLALDLSNNRLRRLNPKWFFDCPYLNTISFKHNQIRDVPARAFDYMKEYKQPTTIHLQSNKISRIAPKAFYNFRRKLIVDLEANRLTALPNDMFDYNSNLFEVNLAENGFQCVTEDILEMLGKTCKFVSFEDNPLGCECKKKLLEFSNNSSNLLDLAYENNVEC